MADDIVAPPEKDYVIGEHRVLFGGPRDDDIVVYPSASGDYATIHIGDETEQP